MKMLSNPDVTAAEFPPGILIFLIKQERFWICIKGSGRAEPWVKGIISSLQMKKPAYTHRKRKYHSLSPKPGQVMRIEHEYQRKGAWAYLAAWDIKRAKIFGRLEESNGIGPFDRLVSQVMSQEPYISAQRVFWIIDNCSCHRGERSVKRLQQQWPNIVPVHLPIHASWLNQIEIYFSIVTRKVLTPNDFSSRLEVRERLLSFQKRYQEVAEPFEWKFTRTDLDRLCAKLKCNEKVDKRELVATYC